MSNEREQKTVRLSDKRNQRLFIRARYDAAQTTTDNARHWANVDSLSADAANSLSIRKTLRERARYEIANNSYAKGIMLTIANSLIGRGPRLQISLKDRGLANKMENDFAEWSRAVNLASKLRTMKMAKSGDGEAFAQMVTNPLISNPVKLDIQLIECDQVTSPAFRYAFDEVDGVFFDAYGNPRKYAISREHPGSDKSLMEYAYDEIAARYILHWFRVDRPGQHRGVSEITPALPLFAQMRRYTQAVLDAAETAADFAMVIYSAAPPAVDEDGNYAENPEPLDTFELERRMATVMPQGWQAGQIKAEQPTNTYPDFKREVLNEISRCLLVPYNVAAGNSSGYNYASGRLDFQDFYRAVEVERDELINVVLSRIVHEWAREEILINDLNVSLDEIKIAYMWDGLQHVDPAKEANAQATKLSSGTTSLSSEYAKEGKDWEEETRAIVYEKLRKLQMVKEIAGQLGIDEKEALAYVNGAPVENNKNEVSEDDEE